MSAIAALLGRQVFGFALGKIGLFLGGLAVMGIAWYFVADYQDRGRTIAAYEVAEAQWKQAEAQLRQSHLRETNQLKSTLRHAYTTNARRYAALEDSEAEIARLKQIERPDHEKSCPVHPAIVDAVNGLWDGDPGTDRDGRGADDPGAAD